MICNHGDSELLTVHRKKRIDSKPRSSSESAKEPPPPPHKVHIYLEYHSVCPLVGIGTPTPFPASEFLPPHRNQREGGGTRLRVRGWGGAGAGGGVPIRTTEKSLALCLLCG
jgi:hypothetical protein